MPKLQRRININVLSEAKRIRSKLKYYKLRVKQRDLKEKRPIDIIWNPVFFLFEVYEYIEWKKFQKTNECWRGDCHTNIFC